MNKDGRMSINIRVHPDLYQRLKSLAISEHRSLSAQITIMLEGVLGTWETLKIDRFDIDADDIIDLGKQDQTTQ